MGDSDPENKVDQVGSPKHGVVLAADADAHQDLIGPASRTKKYAGKQHGHQYPVAALGRGQGVEYCVVYGSVG